VVSLRYSFLLSAMAVLAPMRGDEQSDYYRIITYEVPEGMNLEASGLALLPDGRLAVALRRGEVWIMENPTVEPATVANTKFKRFASGLHEILGLAWHEGALYATQRTEVARLRDTDGDGQADEYRTAATGWGVSGNYHEYAYGPAFDSKGNFYTTLNATIGEKWSGAGEEAKHTLWRGWCLRTSPEGKTEPWAAGFRSPSGIGSYGDDEIFVTDQQGNWFGTNPLLHVRKGAFFGHVDALADAGRADSPVIAAAPVPEGLTVAEAVRKIPGYCLPAVWFPYEKMGQSPTGLVCDRTSGKFGPFAGQMFVGEFVYSGVNRVFLEKVGGEYQGACFPFIKGLQSGVLSVNFLPDGSLVVGQTNRGWNSFGNRPFGLQRLIWTGKPPFAIKTMEALPDGFLFTFTRPVNPASFQGAEGISGQSYSYRYQAAYGSPEVDAMPLVMEKADLAGDGLNLRLRCSKLREGYVHEIQLPPLQSMDKLTLWQRSGYYTLNRIPPALP
jgi:glucose/arabinose dehydrogenase